MAEAALTPASQFSLETVWQGLMEKVFGAAETALTSLGSFQKELVQHVGSITELNSEIAKKNAEFAMEMAEFERDICSIRDYYDTIISSTESVVNYATDQRVIPHIQELIKKKEYHEAEEEINCFLQKLKSRIKQVEDDIDDLKQSCPDLDQVKKKIREKNTSIDGGTKHKENEVAESQNKLIKVGTYTIVYTIAGAVTSMVFFSKAPIEGSEITSALMSAGTEALSFYTGSAIKGLSSVMDASKLSIALKNKITQSVTVVSRCLTGFFNELNKFQEHIHTIEMTCFKQVGVSIVKLKEDVDSGSQLQSAWVSISQTLQKLYTDFTRLSARVSEAQDGLDNDNFKDIMKQLEHGIELISMGTPI